MKVHCLKGYIQNTYLIEYDHRLLMFDSGCRCDVGRIEEFITQKLKRPMSDLKLIALTHSHPDHFGGAYYFQKKYGTPIGASLEVNRYYGGLFAPLTWLTEIILTYWVANKLKRSLKNNLFFWPRVKISYPFVENAPMPLFPDWQVLHTPGHTLADHSFYHESESYCYVADLIIKKRTGAAIPYPIHGPQEYRNSIGLMKELKVQRFLLAHYGEVKFSEKDLDQLLEIAPTKIRSHTELLKEILFKPFKSN